jgi:aryl-phospho-beta-D-glucosidase BglC (GH1 family)
MKAVISTILFAGLFLACSTLSPSPPTALSYTPVGGKPPADVSILSASLASPAARGIVNRFDHTIRFYLPASSDLSALTPVIVTGAGVSVTSTVPASPPFDFSGGPVTYHLSDGSTYRAQAFNTVPSAATVNGWLGTGINLGNDLDAWPGAEGSWTGNVIAQAYFFDDYKTMGFDSVRIPVTWGGALPPTDRLSRAGADSAVNPDFMERVDTVAGWGIDAGLAVVINAHHEDWIRTLTGSSYQAQKPRFVALWTQIARHFQNWPPQLVFEILNEPQGKMTEADVNDLNKTILAVIRATNPTRVVILGAARYNSLDAMQDGVFTVPPPAGDAFIIASFHNYNPWSFAGQSSGTWGAAGDISRMAADLHNAAGWAKSHGVPVYMGEYGVTFRYNAARTDLASRAAWYRQVYQIARASGISMAAWDDSGDFKLYDRVNRSCDSSVIPIITAR